MSDILFAPDGNTLYSHNPQLDMVNICDLTSDASSFNQTAASPWPVVDSMGITLAFTMELIPLDGALFIAGESGLIVQALH